MTPAILLKSGWRKPYLLSSYGPSDWYQARAAPERTPSGPRADPEQTQSGQSARTGAPSDAAAAAAPRPRDCYI